jgi:hypothetical protein
VGFRRFRIVGLKQFGHLLHGHGFDGHRGPISRGQVLRPGVNFTNQFRPEFTNTIRIKYK